MTIVRHATVDDAPDVARVHCQSHLETYGPIFGSHYAAPGHDQREAHWRDRLAAGDIMFVAVEDDHIVGFTHGEEADGHVKMTTLYLLQACQGRGIGRSLLRRILDHFRDHGYGEVHFDCLLQNTAAIAFYLSQGARETSRGSSYDDGHLNQEIRLVIATEATVGT